MKSQLTDKEFRQRELKSIVFTPTEQEQRQFDLLHRILADSARANGKGRAGGLVAMLLKKRFLSSPWSFARTLEWYDQAAGSVRQLEIDDSERYYAEVLGSGQSDEEEGASEHPEFTALRQSKRSDPLVAATGREVEQMVAWGSEYEHRPDPRLRR